MEGAAKRPSGVSREQGSAGGSRGEQGAETREDHGLKGYRGGWHAKLGEG